MEVWIGTENGVRRAVGRMNGRDRARIGLLDHFPATMPWQCDAMVQCDGWMGPGFSRLGFAREDSPQGFVCARQARTEGMQPTTLSARTLM